MKILGTILQVLVFLCIQLNAEELPLPSVEEFLNSTPEKADQVLNTTLGAYQIGDYVKAAVESGRADLVLACFQNKYAFYLTPKAIAAHLEHPQRDEWTILMLKSTSHFWPREGIHDGSARIPKDLMDEPFASLVRRLLPGHPIGDDAVSTKEKRLKLAADLEAALGQDRPAQNTQALQPGGANVQQPSGASSAPASAPPVPPQEPKPSTSWLAWIGVLGALIGVLYLWLKRRQ